MRSLSNTTYFAPLRTAILRVFGLRVASTACATVAAAGALALRTRSSAAARRSFGIGFSR